MSASRTSPGIQSEAEAEILRLAAKQNGTAIELAAYLAGLGDDAAKTIEAIAKRKPKYRRRLFYLLAIWRSLGDLDTPERLTAIGWKKLKIVTQHLDERGVQGKKRDALALKALRLAEKHTVAELPAVLRGESFETKPRRIELVLDARQLEVFESALLDNGATETANNGLAGKEAALTRALRRLGRTPVRAQKRPRTSARSSRSA